MQIYFNNPVTNPSIQHLALFFELMKGFHLKLKRNITNPIKHNRITNPIKKSTNLVSY